MAEKPAAAAPVERVETKRMSISEVLAPPEGLPDMRPLFGLDANQWAPDIFFEEITIQTPMAQTLAAVRNMREVARYESDGFVDVSLLPVDKTAFPGLKYAVITFSAKGEPDAFFAKEIKLHFQHANRRQTAMRQYLLHLLAYRYGPVDDPNKEIIVIRGSERAFGIVVFSLDGVDGFEVDVSFSEEARQGRTKMLERPQFAPVTPIDPEAFAPTEGQPDMRAVIGLDPDRESPAFLPEMLEGTPQSEVFEAVKAAGFAQRGKAKKGRGVFSTRFVPKDKKAFPGVRAMVVHVSKADPWDAWTGFGLDKIVLELNPGLEKSDAFMAQLIKLAEWNFGGTEPEDVEDFMMYQPDRFDFIIDRRKRPMVLEFRAPSYSGAI